MIEPSHYLIAERINYIVVDLRNQYISEHGGIHEWDELTDELFFLNCDINIEHTVEDDGLMINPISLKYGIGRGVTALHYNKDSYYYKIQASDELSFEELDESYENMLARISEFVFG